MLDYIIENKEWLFSGIGLAIAMPMLNFFFKDKVSVRSNITQNQPDNIEKPEFLHSIPSKKLTEAERLAKRFQTTLELMNEGRNYSKITISQIAQLMGLEKISDVEKFFTGRAEPSFSFLEDFCNTFGVYKEWLFEGKRTPYSNNIASKSDPMDYLPLIKAIKPESIYFVREDASPYSAFILLKISQWKYLILGRTWHISEIVGAGGQRQLYSFYSLIKELRDKRNLYRNCWGLTLDKDEFKSLLHGEKFPGKYTEIGFSEDPWWDDLTDIYHQCSIAKNYENWYGTSFINAQEIIKWYISEHEAS